MVTWWNEDTINKCHDDINDDMMTRWNYDMKHNDENYQQFSWKIIIIQCNLPPPNYGRPLHPKLPPTRMTYIPSSMMKMTNDLAEIASLSGVTYHRQITVVHCTQNCHLLVWPIYFTNLYTLHGNPSCTIIVTHQSLFIVTHFSRSILTNHTHNDSNPS